MVPTSELEMICSRKAECLEQIGHSLPVDWPRYVTSTLVDAAEVSHRAAAPDLFRLVTVDIVRAIQRHARLDHETAEIVDRLFEAAQRQLKGDARQLRSRMYLAVRAWLSTVPKQTLVENTQARRTSQYLDTHLGDRLTLNKIGQLSGWSARQLDRVFREHLGVSIHEYLVRARIRRAIELLLQGEKVSSVVAEVGYRNKTSFNRAFLLITGTTPGAFRRAAASLEKSGSRET
jgi:AraC-like DNA-binding protein